MIGSRFLAGGGYGGDMPAYRKLATRMHPWSDRAASPASRSPKPPTAFAPIRLARARRSPHPPATALAQWLRAGGVPAL